MHIRIPGYGTDEAAILCLLALLPAQPPSLQSQGEFICGRDPGYSGLAVRVVYTKIFP